MILAKLETLRSVFTWTSVLRDRCFSLFAGVGSLSGPIAEGWAVVASDTIHSFLKSTCRNDFVMYVGLLFRVERIGFAVETPAPVGCRFYLAAGSNYQDAGL